MPGTYWGVAVVGGLAAQSKSSSSFGAWVCPQLETPDLDTGVKFCEKHSAGRVICNSSSSGTDVPSRIDWPQYSQCRYGWL